MKSPRITIRDETKTIAEWCREFDVFPQSVYRWIALGNTPEEAIELSRTKKVGRPKNEQTPLTKPPMCPKCGSSRTIWNGGQAYKGKRISYIRCYDCQKSSNPQV